MEEYIEKAVAYKNQGYNCAQAVVCAYAKEVGLSESDAYRVSEGFGTGLAGTHQTCGALLGMAMVISLLNGSGKPGDKSTRLKTYTLIQEGLKRFADMNQSTLCCELKGLETHKVLRSCPGCVEDSVRIIEELKKQISE